VFEVFFFLDRENINAQIHHQQKVLSVTEAMNFRKLNWIYMTSTQPTQSSKSLSEEIPITDL
jgi:hypothetical protein